MNRIRIEQPVALLADWSVPEGKEGSLFSILSTSSECSDFPKVPKTVNTSIFCMN